MIWLYDGNLDYKYNVEDILFWSNYHYVDSYVILRIT